MEYMLRRSRRKTLSIQITRGLDVLVRAPMWVPKRDIEQFVAKHTEWIARNREELARRLAANPEPTEEELAVLTAQARAYIPGRVSFYAERMGLTPAAIKITKARTRFGSCSAKNSLCFSCRLMLYPAEAVDYVVVHELAHIVHKNHGSGFYALVASILPDYQMRCALLRQSKK